MNQKYPRHEKLKQKKEISLLFERGKWRVFGNLKLISCKATEEIPIKNQRFGVSVSKRNFKKAVDRNRIKRLLRTCYRLNKELFIEKFGEQSITMVFWANSTMPTNYQEVEKDFVQLCQSKK